MINDVYELVKTIMNKDLRGNVSPADYNLIAKQAQEEIYRGYFEDLNRDQNRDNRGLANQGAANLPQNQRQRLDVFSKTEALVLDTGSTFNLPPDLYMVQDRGIFTGAAVIDEVTSRHVGFYSSIMQPSEVFPVYYREGNKITVYPTTIVSGVSCRYYREPLAPKWTYTVVGGAELFNPAAGDFQDFELNPSEFSNLVIRILSYFGINIRETELTQYAEAMKGRTEAREEN